MRTFILLKRARWCEGPGDFREGQCFVTFPCTVGGGQCPVQGSVKWCVGVGGCLQPVTQGAAGTAGRFWYSVVCCLILVSAVFPVSFSCRGFYRHSKLASVHLKTYSHCSADLVY